MKVDRSRTVPSATAGAIDSRDGASVIAGCDRVGDARQRVARALRLGWHLGQLDALEQRDLATTDPTATAMLKGAASVLTDQVIGATRRIPTPGADVLSTPCPPTTIDGHMHGAVDLGVTFGRIIGATAAPCDCAALRAALGPQRGAQMRADIAAVEGHLDNDALSYAAMQFDVIASTCARNGDEKLKALAPSIRAIARLVRDVLIDSGTDAPQPDHTVAAGDEIPGSTRPSAIPHPGKIPVSRGRARRLVAIAGIVAAAVGLTLLIRANAIEMVEVPTGSMAPTIVPGDRVLVDRLPFVRDAIHRGDIVVAWVSSSGSIRTRERVVKRVVAVGGETVSTSHGSIVVNGRPLREPWLSPLAGTCVIRGYDFRTVLVPAHSFFVLGDCRGNSTDSRSFGPVRQDAIIGKVFMAVWHEGHPWFRWW